MGVRRRPAGPKHKENRFVLIITATTSLISLPMDLYTLIPRTLVGVVYPAFASLKAVLSGSAEQSAAWLRYWVVLGVFSVLELLADLLLKCSFLVWCMAPVKWNGSDLLFNQVDELSEAFAKTSCSCIEDWDYEQDDKVKVSYTLNRRLRIWWMKLKMKIYELIY